MRILLIEDDSLLGSGIVAGLRQRGWTTDWLKHGADALAASRSDTFDAVILDLGLPDMDGMEVLRKLRAEGADLPVLILTARDSVSDRVTGLDKGADDYLTKPFDLEELGARLRALIRRHAGRSEALLHLGEVTLDPAGQQVRLRETPVALTAREFALLEALMLAAGKPLTRNRLEEILYGWDESAEGNVLEVHIHNIRKKLGRKIIETVRGVGYRAGTPT